MNFLGLEIRIPMVEAAEKTRKDVGLDNLKYLLFNALVAPSLSDLLAQLQSCFRDSGGTGTSCSAQVCSQCLFMRRPCLGIAGVSMCFPDPWFKSRHHKRRVSQPEVLDAVGQYVASCSLRTATV